MYSTLERAIRYADQRLAGFCTLIVREFWVRADVLAVALDCYAGHRGDETPRRFTRGDQLIEILAIVAQWRTPDHRYFKVRTAAETCTLRQDVTSGGWELTVVERRHRS